MAHRILGLHHVTATVGAARPDLDFYTGLLGLRLVKKTVNFDNHFVYHFYYGTERGAPSTIMTTFPYAGWGVRGGDQGSGADHRDLVLGAAGVAGVLAEAVGRQRGHGPGGGGRPRMRCGSRIRPGW